MSSGLFYEGGWSNGKKNGEGLIVYPSGNSFGGNWCNDYREGEGKYWIKNRKDNDDKLKSSLLINNIIATRIIITSQVQDPLLPPKAMTIFL